jgi:16S rRNA (uracil1498-N3)-methyltransferase
MIIFYSTNIADGNIILTDDEHTHCAKVLRHQLKDFIKITDGKGVLYNSEIINITKNQTICNIISKEKSSGDTAPLIIGISPTKNPNRIEWFVEKAVEIGVVEIAFFNAVRTEKKNINQTRMQKIAVSAMKQSLNLNLPEIHYFKNLDMLIENYKHADVDKFIAYCDGPTEHLAKSYGKTRGAILLIGPEGDFTAEEINKSLGNGYYPVTLGSSRLRTETAGIVGLIMMAPV